jgi:lysophospholipase L1-like esterase
VAVATGIGACALGSVWLFTSATGASGNVRAASLGGASHAKLGSPAPRRTETRPGSPEPSAGATVSGHTVTAVGDSVMVASTPALDRALPGIFINAMVGRQFATGLQVIAALKASGQLRPIVVVGLGTNGTVTQQEIDQLYAEIGPARKLVLVNTFEARPWEQEVNSTLAAAARARPGTVLANWHATIEHRTDLLWPDGIHPQPAGGVVYAKMLKAALEQLLSLPGYHSLPG